MPQIKLSCKNGAEIVIDLSDNRDIKGFSLATDDAGNVIAPPSNPKPSEIKVVGAELDPLTKVALLKMVLDNCQHLQNVARR
jgi:hypothetical protein